MITVELVVLSTLLIDVALGITVYFTNSRRVVNQHYLLFATSIALWQLAVWYILQSRSEEAATLSIRMASVFAAFIPTSCHLLRLSIKHPDHSFTSILLKARIFLILNVFTTILCFTDFFLETATLPTGSISTTLLVEPKYGGGLPLYALYFLASGISLAILFRRDMRVLKGAQRSELAFVVFGATVALLVGSVLSLFIPLIAGTSQYVPFSNAISIITLIATIGYGIATHRILGIVTIIRRCIAYSLLAVYLVGLYLCTWGIFTYLLKQLAIDPALPAQIIATLAVAFSMAPVHGRLQKVADKLIASKAMDIPITMKKAGEIFQSVTTINALLNHFSNLLVDALGAEHVKILSAQDAHFIQSHPQSPTGDRITYPTGSAVVELIATTREPVCRDSLMRIRETPKIRAAANRLKEDHVSVATGIFSTSGLSGIVLFGPRLDGRIYDKKEQDALQLLCNQFAVALENAHLYTEMQDSKIRNEILLDQLVSGVIVANMDRKITLINHEAQRVIGLEEDVSIGQEINLLPKPVAQALETTLIRQSSMRNIDATLIAEETEEVSTTIRMGSAYLIGHDGKPMGALLVFTDMTELKKLEEQVRRSDQLSSVGTLAAGMAHEIKNPLVTIKTFTQLLPERYADEDFRQDFSSLVAHEVSRIDGIVNQLLCFSKPTKPHLAPMPLHDTIEQTLKLINEQLLQKNIELKTTFRAKEHLISGDSDLLTQALVNLNLNAIDAIENDGHISVGTSNCTYRFVNSEDAERIVTKPCIRLQISDTGKGIAADQLHKIFDPFFTSKSEGTGMGLSVAHGIIQEHQGVIEVESEPEKGTTFYIYLPILKGDAAA
jgi:nitrogen-specific signal transduction histidine kinase